MRALIQPSLSTGIGKFRRGSLISLAGAALATTTSFSVARAGKNTKQDRKRAKKRADKLCGEQVESCRAAYDDMCDGISRPSCFELRDAIQACCVHLGNCQAGDTFTCILDVTATANQRRLEFHPG